MIETSQSQSVLPELAATALPGRLLDCKFSGHIPDLLNQKLWMGGPPACVLISSTDDFDSKLMFENHCSRQNFRKGKKAGAVIYE